MCLVSGRWGWDGSPSFSVHVKQGERGVVFLLFLVEFEKIPDNKESEGSPPFFYLR